ncbi:MAG: FAD binding domain-containing protein [Solirubrobacteraceae bacterium]
MIAAEFDYVAPESLEEAIRALSEGGEDAKLLAGGHSLLPMMKLRFATPSLLVDLRRVPGLAGVNGGNGGSGGSGGSGAGTVIGAMTTHTAVAGAGLGLVSAAAAKIADPQVRNRGTIGGSLAAPLPAADLPAVVLAAEGVLVVRGPDGSREIAAADFFRGYMETAAVAADEVVTEVRLPSMDGWSFGYEKFNRRQEDWAMVGVCVLVEVSDGVCSDVRIGLTNMGGTPLRAAAAEAALRGQPLSGESIAAAAAEAADATTPPADINASSEYRRHLARVLCRRALEQAAAG